MIILIGCGTLGARTARTINTQRRELSKQTSDHSVLSYDYRLLLVDHDRVEKRNVGVQLYTEQEIGLLKAQTLASKLPKTYAQSTFIDHTNLELLKEAAVIVDCTDNLATRLLINQYCVDNGIPLVHAAASETKGFVGLFTTKPCLACVYGGKISLEACRGADLNVNVVEQLATRQAELALNCLEGREEHEFSLVTEHNTIPITIHNNGCPICRQETTETPKHFYITYCTQAGCMTAKPVGRQALTPRKEIHGNITVEIFANGEIHFSQGEVDELQTLASILYRG